MHSGLTYKCSICETVCCLEEKCPHEEKWYHFFYKYYEWIKNFKENLQ